MKSLVPVLISFLCLASPAFALDYNCPTDPGFCYLDVGNDGCFDSGTDVGPIDDQLETGDFPSPPGPPDPGSIVCPPRVKTLTTTNGIDWHTAAGGSILLHAARINAIPQPFVSTELIRMDSGERI